MGAAMLKALCMAAAVVDGFLSTGVVGRPPYARRVS